MIVFQPGLGSLTVLVALVLHLEIYQNIYILNLSY